MFGYTEEQIAWFGLTFGVGAFMLYMVFIIFQLARESKAGRFGTVPGDEKEFIPLPEGRVTVRAEARPA